jgi:predicted RNA-binding protein with PUA-like domain
MPNYWIMKTEPTTYSYADLEREGTAVWDGVQNPVALKHIRAMRSGDQVLIYHTGTEKAVVGLAKAVSDPYPDPKDPTLAVIKLEAQNPLPQPVTLATVKADKMFSDLGLVRMGRLSVMPASPAQFRALAKLGGGGGMSR